MSAMTKRPWQIVGALSLGLILGQVAIMAVPAVVVELAGEWSVNAAQIGWVGGIYFAGYAVGLPFLSGAASRGDGRTAYVASAAIAGIASFAFAIEASGFWSAIVLRFMAGVGFSGIHIVGMKLMVDRLEGDNRARAGAFYSAAYALGSGTSFLIAGLLSSAFGWRATFVAAGASALLAIPLLLAIGPPLEGNEIRSSRWFPDFRAVLREREVVRYVIAYAGNTWEVFAIRVWFVPFLAFSAALNGYSTTSWPPSILAGVSAIVAVRVSIVIAEVAIRLGRDRVIRAVA
jgi:MFS family permease